MNAYANNRKYFAIIAALLMAVAAFAAVSMASDNSDAVDPTDVAITGISDSGFKQDENGTLTVSLNNKTGEAVSVVVKVKDTDGDTLAQSPVDISGETATVSLQFKLSSGTHAVDVFIYDDASETTTIWAQQDYSIDVAKNIWSNVSTYLAIILIVIIVIVIAVIYMRQVPKKKPTTTFTQLEEERKAAEQGTAPSAAATSTKTEKKKYGSSEDSTGKIKYTSSRRK